jgi:hypothetical protein
LPFIPSFENSSPEEKKTIAEKKSNGTTARAKKRETKGKGGYHPGKGPHVSGGVV